MGCKHSLFKQAKPTAAPKKKTGSEKSSKKATVNPHADQEDCSLSIPVVESPLATRSVGSAYSRSVHRDDGEPVAQQSSELAYLRASGSDEVFSTSSSAPHILPSSSGEASKVKRGSWAWWRQEVRRDRVTKDGSRRAQLQDIETRLTCQHDENEADVELDLSNCFMERTAPYVLGRLFASSHKELKWITSLRLDGNYFTDHGFGTMLGTMSAANKKGSLLPALSQLYLNNMNLDPDSITGIFAYLFPTNMKTVHKSSNEADCCIAGSCISPPPLEYISEKLAAPKVPLFPALTVLSLSDNPGLGAVGLQQVLRSLLSVHYQPHILAVIDLSRCGLDGTAAQDLRDYFTQLPSAIDKHFNPVVPRRFVLIGNHHGIAREEDVLTFSGSGVQLVL